MYDWLLYVDHGMESMPLRTITVTFDVVRSGLPNGGRSSACPVHEER
jgi:hypothetical protein